MRVHWLVQRFARRTRLKVILTLRFGAIQLGIDTYGKYAVFSINRLLKALQTNVCSSAKLLTNDLLNRLPYSR